MPIGIICSGITPARGNHKLRPLSGAVDKCYLQPGQHGMENIHGAICIKIFVEILNIISKPFLQRSGTRAHVNVLCKLDISKSKRLRKAASSVL